MTWSKALFLGELSLAAVWKVFPLLVFDLLLGFGEEFICYMDPLIAGSCLCDRLGVLGLS